MSKIMGFLCVINLIAILVCAIGFSINQKIGFALVGLFQSLTLAIALAALIGGDC